MEVYGYDMRNKSLFFGVFFLAFSFISIDHFYLLKYLIHDAKKLKQERKASFCHTYLISKNRRVKESGEQERRKK